MPINRRELVAFAAGGIVNGLLTGVAFAGPKTPTPAPKIKAIAFDAFPIFDPRSVFALADGMFPGSGLSEEWRTRQFEYTWLRVAARRYADFWQVTGDALAFAANKLKLKIEPAQRAKLMNAYLELRAWPDVPPALATMKKAGLRLSLLSNLTDTMLAANIESAGLDGMFEQVLSTNRARTYKPDPRAYQLGTDVMKLRREEVLFVAFAGWDAAGAKLFGYPTYWVNRQKLPVEELGAPADGSGNSLSDLVEFLAGRGIV